MLLPVHFLLVPVAVPIDFLTVEQGLLNKQDYLNCTLSDYFLMYLYHFNVLCIYSSTYSKHVDMSSHQAKAAQSYDYDLIGCYDV